VEPKLMGGHTDAMTGRVVTDLCHQVRHLDPNLLADDSVSKVENLRDRHLAR
jgi:hypothetical protein